MTETKPMTTFDPVAAAKEAATNQKAYDDATATMDRRLYERVRAFHPHANSGPDALKAMTDDYARLKADQDKVTAEAADKPGAAA
jgi:hypothetical protein